jgi:hypothetical protein
MREKKKSSTPGRIITRFVGNGREELKALLSWMMPLFNTPERRDKVCWKFVLGGLTSAIYLPDPNLEQYHLKVSTSPWYCRH